MKRSFFVHTQAEGKSPENFETTYSFLSEAIASEGKAQNEALSED